MSRVLLLNPPSRTPVARDCLIGGACEPEVLVPPADLAILSGRLSPRFDVVVLDAVAEELSPAQARARAAAAKPDAVVALVAGATFMLDGAFLAELREDLPRARFLGLGDAYSDVKELAFALHPFLDGILLDYSGEDAAAWLEGDGGPSTNVVSFKDREPARGPRRRRFGGWDAPPPRWDLFPLEKYRWPFSKGPRRAAPLTEYGCPYPCGYCPSSTLGHRARPLESVVAEWKGLAALKVSDALLRDQAFGADRARSLSLCAALGKVRGGPSWIASMRVDCADAELLKSMAGAGCAAVMFGIDSGDDEVLRAYKKNTTRKQAEAAVAAAHAAGLKAWGQLLIGLAMDTRETAERTLEFGRALGLDHVSWRAESQRYAADYRRELLVRGHVPPEAMPPDTPTSISTWHGRMGLSNQDAFAFLERAGRGR